MRILLPILSILLFAIPLTLHAAKYENHSHLRQLASAYLRENVATFKGEKMDISVGKIDSHLKLPVCSEDTRVFLPSNSQNQYVTTVAITCEGKKTWTIYVPTQVKILVKVVVASHSIPQGATITKNDLELAERNRATLGNGYFLIEKPLVGKATKRPLRAGAVITRHNIKSRTLARRG